MENNYFFIDGSSLLSDIKRIKVNRNHLSNLKFDLISFARYFSNSFHLRPFHAGNYRRIVYYFVKDDKRIQEYIKVPDFRTPRLIEDIQIKYCGKKITQYKKAKEWLDFKKAPNYVRDSLYKSEKAVDTQICCDALVLLSLNKLDRLFLYTNDYDYIPLCQSIKTMGANINLIQLTKLRVNSDLVRECDAFYTFDDETIDRCFAYKKQGNNS